jgi:uncharacterized protein (DUF305 family)
MVRSIAAALAIGVLFVTAASAQTTDTFNMHQGHGAPPATTPGSSPSTEAFKASNARMHSGMTQTFTGNANIDFIKGMPPHHQGAVDMAKVVLQYGHDPEARELAEEIIKAQNTEIDWMKGWLAKHGQ